MTLYSLLGPLLLHSPAFGPATDDSQLCAGSSAPQKLLSAPLSWIGPQLIV